jgi:hypothetical protein
MKSIGILLFGLLILSCAMFPFDGAYSKLEAMPKTAHTGSKFLRALFNLLQLTKYDAMFLYAVVVTVFLLGLPEGVSSQELPLTFDLLVYLVIGLMAGAWFCAILGFVVSYLVGFALAQKHLESNKSTEESAL